MPLLSALVCINFQECNTSRLHKLHPGGDFLEGIYKVYLGSIPVGKVQLIRQGLYYRIQCRCRIEGNLVYKLYAVIGNKRENLGVVIPDGDGFSLEKRIPVKRLGEEGADFILSTGAGLERGIFVPICPEEPFQYIERLKDAFLETENGRLGIRIQQKTVVE